MLFQHKNDLLMHEENSIHKSLSEREQVENVLTWLMRRWEAAGWQHIRRPAGDGQHAGV